MFECGFEHPTLVSHETRQVLETHPRLARRIYFEIFVSISTLVSIINGFLSTASFIIKIPKSFIAETTVSIRIVGPTTIIFQVGCFI